MKIYPSKEDLKARLRLLIKLLKAALILAALGLAGWMVFFAFKLVPMYANEYVRNTLIGDQVRWVLRQHNSMRSDLLSLLDQQCRSVGRFSQIAEAGEVNPDSLREGLSSKYVLDAFWFDFAAQKGVLINGTIPLDTLLKFASKNAVNRKVSNDQISWRKYGVKYVFYKSVNDTFLLIVRYFKWTDPQAYEAVGLVLDYPLLLSDYKERLESEYLTYTGVPTEENIIDWDGSRFNHSRGVLFGEDTLWWHGSRETPIVSFNSWDKESWQFSGYVDKDEGLGMTFMARAIPGPFGDILESETHRFVLMVKVVILVCLSTIVILVAALLLSRRRLRRKQC
ncbi:MAG: hypothetical protein V2A61_03755 [Calditrichota bacterium]